MKKLCDLQILYRFVNILNSMFFLSADYDIKSHDSELYFCCVSILMLIYRNKQTPNQVVSIERKCWKYAHSILSTEIYYKKLIFFD